MLDSDSSAAVCARQLVVMHVLLVRVLGGCPEYQRMFQGAALTTCQMQASAVTASPTQFATRHCGGLLSSKSHKPRCTLTMQQLLDTSHAARTGPTL
jgi:hypothetical protein